jgi:hypothetical protein
MNAAEDGNVTLKSIAGSPQKLIAVVGGKDALTSVPEDSVASGDLMVNAVEKYELIRLAQSMSERGGNTERMESLTQLHREFEKVKDELRKMAAEEARQKIGNRGE